MEPQAIGRYEIVREVGRGMMGVVYEAHDPALNRTVAVKTIQLAFAVTPGQREEFERRFFAEAKIAARLSHPGIVVVHDVGKDPATGTLFIVFEYLSGQTLGDEISGGRAIPWREALRICAKVADAIHHAHATGVVHRDLKPANIMVLESGEPKIMDFGVAKIETARIQMTATGQFFGSPLFMSPEQSLGNQTDARTDIFSLGTILCTLALGRPLYAAPNIPQILARIIREEPPALSQMVPGVPVDLDYVLARAMAKLPEDRYPQAGMMGEDMEDVLAGAPPRHAAGWNRPAPINGTVASHAALSASLEELLAIPGLAGTASGGSATQLDPASELSGLVESAEPAATPSAGRSAPSAPSTGEQPLLSPKIAFAALAAVAVLPLLLLVFVFRRGPAEPGRADLKQEPRRPPAQVIVSPVPFETPKPERTVHRATPPRATLPPLEPLEVAEPGKNAALMDVVFEHGLKKGVLKLWVDDVLILQEQLRAPVTKKVLILKVRKGRLARTLSVVPGKHTVRVQVSWDDTQRNETTWYEFPPASRRLLLVKLRAGRDLSLEWRRKGED